MWHPGPNSSHRLCNCSLFDGLCWVAVKPLPQVSINGVFAPVGGCGHVNTGNFTHGGGGGLAKWPSHQSALGRSASCSTLALLSAIALH